MKLSIAPLLALAVGAAIPPSTAGQGPEPPASAAFRQQRAEMVSVVRREGIVDEETLRALARVPRHEFVPAEYRPYAYENRPLPIGYGQTISQPYIVAFMTEILQLDPGMKVLEIGTGSGYQAAVLAEVGVRAYTVEIFEALHTQATQRLERLGFVGVTTRHADGRYGWSRHAPYDAVIVTAAGGSIPPALVEQLKLGGRMIIPVGSLYGVQHLILVEKVANGEVRTRSVLPVRFVPMLQGIR